MTNCEVMNYSKKILSLFHVDEEDIEKVRLDDEESDTTVLTRALEEFLIKELAFRDEQVFGLEITNVTKSKKEKTVYVHMKSETSVSQVFKRAATIRKDDLRITNYVAPQIFDRYNTLHLYCKQQRTSNPQLRTKVTLGNDDLVLMTKKVGDSGYIRQSLNIFRDLPDFIHDIIWPPVETIPLTTPF